MRNNGTYVTTIQSNGTVEAEYDVVTFSVNAMHHAPTAVEAKKGLEEKVVAIKDTIGAIKNGDNGFVKDSLISSASVQLMEKWKNNSRLPDGYAATYSASFKMKNMEAVNDVYDILTSLKDISVYPPHFDVTKVAELNDQAMKKALDRCRKKFETQCAILGKNPKDYHIAAWDARYYRDYDETAAEGAAVAASASRGMHAGGRADSSIDINPGKAQIIVALSISMAKSHDYAEA